MRRCLRGSASPSRNNACPAARRTRSPNDGRRRTARRADSRRCEWHRSCFSPLRRIGVGRRAAVFQKRMFKVICPIEKRGGGTYWMRMGTGFTNKDDSINIYLDALPKNFQLQLREMDEEDLRRRDGSTSTMVTSSPSIATFSPTASPTSNDVPF